jgi:hypothetical protein
MNKKCQQCGLVNFPAAKECGRCRSVLTTVESPKTATPKSPRHKVARRVLICLAVCIAIIPVFYLSLLASATSLSYDQKRAVNEAIAVLKDKGFADEAALLERLAVFKADDNWLNASVAKEDAYAATNFPFGIVTLYPDFFTYPRDATERAAILLHESKHLAGADEHDAYEFAWKHRGQLGWTKEKYGDSPVWRNIRRQTRDNVPALFVCDINEFNDCTELP